MKNNFLTNIFKLSSAPVVTQVFSLLLLPIITRLYSPSDFGIYNLFTSLIGVFTVFCGMGYHQAIVLPKKDKDAFVLFVISMALNILLTLLVIFVINFIPQEYFLNFKIESLYNYKYLICIAIFFHGLYVTLLGWHLRFSNFGLISISRITRVLSNKLFIILIAIISFASAKYLIYGEIIGSVFVCFIMFAYTNIYKHLFFSFKVLMSECVKLALAYKQFPIFSVSNDLLFRLKQALIIFLITYFFSVELVGNYGIALLILAIPTTLLGSSIGEVFYKRISLLEDISEIGLLSLRLFKILCYSSIFVFTFLAFFSQEILPFFLGEKWVQAGTLISILSFGIFMEFIFSPMLNLLKVLHKQQFLFFYQLLMMVVSTISILIGGFLNNFHISFILFSIFSGLSTLCLGLYVFKLVNIKALDILNLILKNLYFLFPFLSLFTILKFYNINNIFYLILVGLICFLLNFIISFRLNNDFKLELCILIKKIPFLNK